MYGFSVATEDASWFYPLKYPEDNYHDPAAALAWLKDQCKTETDKVFHNAMYDIEALDSEGIEVRGKIHDTMMYEALFNESKSVSLDATATRRLGITKDETLLVEAAAAYGIDPKAEMYKLPARFVGPYGAQDAALLPGILASQLSDSADYNMGRVLDLESRLIRPVFDMRKNGVRVDLERAHELDVEWKASFEQHMHRIYKLIPFEINVWKPKQLIKMCEFLKIPIQKTAAGNPSFTNEWLENSDHPALKELAAARQFDKMRRDFLKGQIFDYEINGRIHPQYHTTRRDDGGTRSGRFSCANPNLQQAPARHPLFGGAIRGLYLPDDGAEWGKFDYSSQEPRITLHLANIAGIASAQRFVEMYRKDPKFCQHSYAAEVLDISRQACKDINLGLTYGMGVPSLSYKLGVDISEAWGYRNAYDEALPFVSEVAERYTEHAQQHEYIETVLGRRSFFTGADVTYCYKGLNRAVQGSGADLMKTAIVTVYEEMNVAPLVTVHDESDYNIWEEEHAYQISEIMEHAIEMTIPQVVEPELGPSWGECK